MPIRIIIAGGGTGGHIFPAVAIGHAVQRLSPGAELLFVGAEGRMEMEKVPQEGFRIIGLPIAGFDRGNLLKNLTLPFKLLKSLSKARKVISDFKPHAVVGVGGYASFPVLRAAQSRNIPTLIQEQNSFAGKSNKILARKAKAICVAYEGMEKFFPANKILLTGNPVRKSISQSTVSKAEARAALGIDPEAKLILIVGGSLGAKSVNEAIGAGLEKLMAEGVQLLWQTGKPYIETAKVQAAPYAGRVLATEFIRQMDLAYAASDLVVSRAGALAIAELCIAAKPVIFVPYPFAAEDHQTSNAMALVKHSAAQIVSNDAAATDLVPKLISLLHDEAAQSSMSEALRKLAIHDADDRIARELIAMAHPNLQNQ
jgi:UDP-N-acetylglucosamine--N-acetylmuramyl-(pentapeptide) pyrophosphoryl-undecaprenol N-acetylglucosamine transferase